MNKNYSYDAWGRVIAVTDANGNAITGENHIGNTNPLRYRGYMYDTETKLYYCNSRYYDPQVKRFINIDMYVSTGTGFLGLNMYAYCNNNPVMYSDPSGNIGLIVVGVVIVGTLFLTACSVNQQKNKVSNSSSQKTSPQPKPPTTAHIPEERYYKIYRKKDSFDYCMH